MNGKLIRNMAPQRKRKMDLTEALATWIPALIAGAILIIMEVRQE